MNWDALGRETVELGREYLTLDTTNPPGNETVGARFLERVLGRDGIASEIAESAPGRGNLVARLPGAPRAASCSTTTSTWCTRTGGTGRWTPSGA
jgi:acetylornithine deacetylase/succinyl-diaminopimelate desuccinylase-like protein